MFWFLVKWQEISALALVHRRKFFKKWSDFVHLFEDGTKWKIPSEITSPPVKLIFGKNQKLLWRGWCCQMLEILFPLDACAIFLFHPRNLWSIYPLAQNRNLLLHVYQKNSSKNTHKILNTVNGIRENHLFLNPKSKSCDHDQFDTKCDRIYIITRGWLSKFGDMLHSMLWQDLNKK